MTQQRLDRLRPSKDDATIPLTVVSARVLDPDSGEVLTFERRAIKCNCTGQWVLDHVWAHAEDARAFACAHGRTVEGVG